MPERLVAQPEQPLKVEVNKSFRPFEKLKTLSGPEIFKGVSFEHSDTRNIIAAREIEIDGVKTSIALFIPNTLDLEHIDHEIPGVFDTPLGEVLLEYSYLDGLRVATKVPLQPIVISALKSPREYFTLKKYRLELTMGEMQYDLDLPEGPEESVDQSIEKIKRNQQTIGINFRNEEAVGVRGEVNILLPYDPTKLSEIEAKIIEVE